MNCFFVDLTSSNSGCVGDPGHGQREIFNDDLIADLQVSLQRLPGQILPGGPISYQVVVQNLSNVVPVPSAAFLFTASARHTSISWTCAASAGSKLPGKSARCRTQSTMRYVLLFERERRRSTKPDVLFGAESLESTICF